MRNRKHRLLLTVVLLGTTLLSACGTTNKTAAPAAGSSAPVATPAAGEKTVKHVWGETKVKGVPSKVVALDFYIVDTMVSLGVSPAGIAGTDKTRVPAYVKDKVQKFTDVGERKEPNLEVIRSVQPDLIIANPERAKMIKNELSQITTTLALSDKSYKDIMNNVELLGDLLGKQAEAQKVKQDLENKVKAAKEKLKTSPSVLVVGAFEDEYSVWVKSSFIGTLLTDAGVKYVFEGAKEASEGKADIAKLTAERLAELNPDYMFVYGSQSSIDKMKANPLMKNLKAVQEGRLIPVEQDLWSRGRGPIAAGLILDQALPVLTGEAKK